MGVADPDIVKFYTEPTRRHTFKSEFNIASLPADPKDLPRSNACTRIRRRPDI